MKLRFEPDRNEWELPESELQTALAKAISQNELQRTSKMQNRKFVVTLLYSTFSVIGATGIVIAGQFGLFPLIAGAVMYGSAYEVVSTYLKEK